MAGLQQKRKSPKSLKGRRKAIPVVILKTGQGTLWNNTQPAPR